MLRRAVTIRVAAALSERVIGVRSAPVVSRLLATSSHKNTEEEFDFFRPITDHTAGGYRIVTVNDEEADRLDDIVTDKKYFDNKKDLKTAAALVEQRTPEESKLEDPFTERGVDVNRIKGFMEMNPFVCHGCGSPFQSKAEDSPGFLPSDKMATHQIQAEKIRVEQETIKLLQQTGYQVGSAASVKLMEKAKISQEVISSLNRFSVDGESFSFKDSSSDYGGSSSAIDLREAKEIYKKENEDDHVAKCQRCFRLQQYGQISDSLRLGWSKHELLSPSHFLSVLKPICSSKAVILCLVDVFDLQGSLLANLREIAGDNPIVIAANKFDLLPKDAAKQRIHSWIHDTVRQHCNMMTPKEAEDMKYKQFESRGWIRPKERNSEEGILYAKNVHLISCQTGEGVEALLKNVFSQANEHGNKVYVMGAANVGKSSFINRLLKLGSNKASRNSKKKAKGKQDSVPKTTVSNLPGTTLNMLKIKLPNGITVFDTPGLINEGQLTTLLTPKELNDVIPATPINPVTLRAEVGRSILMGAFARIELIEGRPFNFTFFISNEVKLRPVRSEIVDEFVTKHVGGLISPPNTVERLTELGPLVEYEFEVLGDGWARSAVDMVIAGLGWVAITGVGNCRIKISVPGDTKVSRRSCLLPFESRSTGVKFTGGRFIKKSVKKGKVGKTLGYRAL